MKSNTDKYDLIIINHEGNTIQLDEEIAGKKRSNYRQQIKFH